MVTLPTDPYDRAVARLMLKLDRTEACWTNPHAPASGAAKVVWREGPTVRGRSAARAVYEIHHGEISDDDRIRHSCSNTKCLNPDHLEMISDTIVELSDEAQEQIEEINKLFARRAARNAQ